MFPKDSFQYQAPVVLNLGMVPWPKIKEYGEDHHQKTAQLAKYLTEYYPELTTRDKNIVWCVASLHDSGRTGPYGHVDVSHYERSADIAAWVLKNSGDEFNHPDFISEVTRLIAHHSYKEKTNDPRLQVIHDAERMESCRFEPNTKLGLRQIREICDHKHFYTKVLRDNDFIKGWMKFRGWNIG